MNKFYHKKSFRQAALYIFDACLITASYYISFLLRFDGTIPGMYGVEFIKTVWIVVLVRLTSFYFARVYRGIWRFAGISHLLNIIKGGILGSIVFVAIMGVFIGYEGYPRSVIIIDTILITLFMGGGRFFRRIYFEASAGRKGKSVRSAIIFGAGNAGNNLAKELKMDPDVRYEIKGFIDDDRYKHGMLLQNIPVLGGREVIEKVTRKHSIDEIIIAIPRATRKEMRDILQVCENSGIEVKTMPSLGDLIDGKVSYSNIRNVRIEDLLGRDVAEVDKDLISAHLKGKKVLVTGAGGSIGSEICRQVMKYSPEYIVLLGRGEHSIYKIHKELSIKYDKSFFEPVIGDVINKRKMLGVLKKFTPDIIFHAGADKHVPIMESNIDEAILNNIIGTKNVLESASETGVSEVVCISTDKAANPVSVMGCSKRIAEMLVQSAPAGKTKFIAVRFGNVLASRGSVIPLFRDQIKSGGPVTVTHKDMTRYFMTILEAASLVIQAAAMGSTGNIYFLDMGSPVKIFDLASQMIRLSGLEPGLDVDIKITGLRPGEKINEALTGKGESLERTAHSKILVIKSEKQSYEKLEGQVEKLKEYAINMDDAAIVSTLLEIAPNFTPSEKLMKDLGLSV